MKKERGGDPRSTSWIFFFFRCGSFFFLILGDVGGLVLEGVSSEWTALGGGFLFLGVWCFEEVCVGFM